jgi:transcriptional regulator with AAA-type ATPase domain
MAGGQPVRVLDAADATLGGPGAWLRELAAPAVAGEVLVLRHVDRLDLALARATHAELARRGPGRVLATSAAGGLEAGPGNPLLESFDVELVVPPLRDRLEDLPLLLAALTARALGDGSSVRWMPDAVQALSRVEWSGNLTSLDAVVRRVVARRRTGYLGAGDLPADLIARASRRRLARLEQAEAQTIMLALREAGGNKYRAAESLGIARSTLYRKVRALGLDLSAAAF